MLAIHKAKPATAETVNGLLISEQLAGQLDFNTTRSLQEIQARRVARRFSLPDATANVVAELAFARCCG